LDDFINPLFYRYYKEGQPAVTGKRKSIEYAADKRGNQGSGMLSAGYASISLIKLADIVNKTIQKRYSISK